MKRRWTFWVKGRKVVQKKEEAEVKVTAIFKIPVSEEEAKRLLRLE